MNAQKVKTEVHVLFTDDCCTALIVAVNRVQTANFVQQCGPGTRMMRLPGRDRF